MVLSVLFFLRVMIDEYLDCFELWDCIGILGFNLNGLY